MGDARYNYSKKLLGVLCVFLLIDASVTIMFANISYSQGFLPLHPGGLVSAKNVAGLLFTCIPTIILAPLILGSFVKQSLRRAEMKKLCSSAGFSFDPFPSDEAGEKIIEGSNLESPGKATFFYHFILRGLQGDRYFRVVDFSRLYSRNSDIQTVICADVKNSHFSPFALVKKSFWSEEPHSAQLELTRGAPGCPSGYSLFADPARLNDRVIPDGFLDVFSEMEGFNVEFLGKKLIVYRASELIPSNRVVGRVICAIKMAKSLEVKS